MAWTSQDLANVEAAIASGASSVTYADAGGGTRIVRYRSIAELENARAAIRQYLDSINGTIAIRQTRMWTDKGWQS